MLEVLSFLIATMSPVVELRGGIPLGLAMGLTPEFVIPVAIIVNCLIFFPIYFGLELLWERFFARFGWAQRLMERVHRKGSKYIQKYEVIGLAIFVGIPLPVTGVWTGTAIAWLMDLDWKKSFLSICLGVLIAGTIISILSLGFIQGLNFFLKT